MTIEVCAGKIRATSGMSFEQCLKEVSNATLIGNYTMSEMMIFSGNANPRFTQSIADHLQLPLGQANISRFSDGEIQLEILENVRGNDVFIVQSTCSPTNDNVMEMMFMADALRRASAQRITAVIPYYGYARQDRRVYSARVPISAKVIADMMSSVGIDRLLTVDLHADQIQGFFHMPVDNVYSTPAMLEDIKRQHIEKPLVISPDVGGVVRARAYASKLSCDLAIIDKRRPRPNESKVMHIIGDVKDRNCIIVDDIVDTAGTLCLAASALKNHGAESVRAYISHPVLSGPAVNNIQNSELDEIVVSDTIPLTAQAQGCNKIRQISIAPIVSEAIHRVSCAQSISSMFAD